MNWELLITILSLLVACGAFYVTLWVYHKHDKVLKEQQKELNSLQIKILQEGDEDKRKALIKGNTVCDAGGRDVLYVFNAGKSVARNIRMEVLSESDDIIDLHFSPCEFLNPQDGVKSYFLLCEGHTPSIKVKWVWDDDYGNDRENIQLLNIA